VKSLCIPSPFFLPWTVIHHKISAGLSTHLADNEDVSNKGCVMYKIRHNLIIFQNVARFKFVVMIMLVEGAERKMNSNVDA
jgi:hypothetical protein